MPRPKTKRTIVEEEIDDSPRVLPPDPDDETLDYALKQFDDRDGLELKYYLSQPGGAAFIGAYPDIVPDTQLQDWYPQGGKFEIRIYVHGEFRDRRFSLIAPRPGGLSSAPGGSESAEIRRLNDKLDMLMQQRNAGPQTTMEGLAAVIKTVSEIQRPTDNGSGLMEAIKLGVSLANSGGKIEDDSFMGTIKSIAKEAGPAIIQGMMMKAPQNGAQPQQLNPAPQQVTPEEAGMILLRTGIAWLKKKAVAGKDPLLYADLIMDNAETDERAQYILRACTDTEFDVFAQLDPEIAKPPYVEFFREFYDGLRRGSNETGPVVADSGRANGHATDTPANAKVGKARGKQ